MRFIFLMFLICGACAKSSPTNKTDLPSQTPASTMSTWCGKDILIYGGFVFQVDLTSGATTYLPDGRYGHDSYTNGWGTTIPECWFQVSGGTVGASL